MTRPGSRVEAALDELCTKYGYCLRPEKAEALIAGVPDDLARFVDAVLAAEDRDPSFVDRREREALLTVVWDWPFDDGRGRGTQSGLPRTPASTP